MLDENEGQAGSCQLHSRTPNLLTGGGFSLLAGGPQLLCGIGQPSENTAEQLGQVLPHLPEWETKGERMQGVPQMLGAFLFHPGKLLIRSPVNLDRAEVSQFSFSTPRGKWELMAGAADV